MRSLLRWAVPRVTWWSCTAEGPWVCTALHSATRKTSESCVGNMVEG